MGSSINDNLSSERAPPDPGLERAFGERFVADQLLAEANGVETWRCTDLQTDTAVALKTASVKGVSPSLLTRVEREADLLCRIKDTSLAPMIEWGHEGDQLYVARAFVSGTPLEKLLKESSLTLLDSLVLGSDILKALKIAHDQGILHGAIRPHNVIVGRSASRGAALINTGLFQNQLFDVWNWVHQSGAALYLSPEQAGALDCEVSVASDLYSTGLLLFECIAGHPPFESDDFGGLLLEHMTAQIPDLRGGRYHVPRVVNEIVQRLLRKDPRDRYQSADAVIVDLEAVAGALREGDLEPRIVVGSHDRRTTLTEPAFVSRDDELKELEKHVRRAGHGRGEMILLECDSGGGKSRILDELALRAARDGVRILRGQGVHQVGQTPFQILDGVSRGFASAAKRDSTFAEDVWSRLGPHRESAMSVLPAAAESLDWKSEDTVGPEQFGETRSIIALVHFLEALGSKSRPAVVLLDDCQWADELTIKLAVHWNRRRADPDQEPCYVALVAAFRSEEVGDDHLLRQIESPLHLRLSPLRGEELRRMLESMAGPLPSEAVDIIGRLSEGNPFMASAMLRGMVESGALVSDADGWQIEPRAMADVRSSSHAGALLSRRIDLLPPATIQLLGAGAVLGKEFDLDLAATLTSHSVSDAISALEDARRQRVVWLRPDGMRCAFVHDKIRAALLERLSVEDRQDLHRIAAIELSRQEKKPIYDLAYHFDAAGEHKLALGCAIVAAEEARSLYSLEIAEQFYRIAAKGISECDDETGYRVVEGLGDVLLLRGRYDEAEGLFQQASALADGKFAQAEIKGKLGELSFKRGEMEAAAVTFEEALRLLGQHVPRSLVVCTVFLLWEVFRQAAHTALPRCFVGRRKAKPNETQLLVLRLLSRLAHAYWFVRGKARVFWSHLVGLNLAELYEPTPELAQAYSEHAPGMTLIGYFSRGITYAKKSLEIRKSLGDVWGQGQSLHYHSVVLYTASRFRECIDVGREAVRLLERTGDFWEVHIAHYQIAASQYRLGDLQAAREEAEWIHRSGILLGDHQASGISLDVWARADPANIPPAILETEIQRVRHDAQGTGQVLLGEGARLVAAGELERAEAVFRRAIAVARQAHVWNTYISPNLAWLATTLRIAAESRVSYGWKYQRLMLRRAKSVARHALRETFRFPNELPHALREYAAILAMLGQTRQARRLFRKSLTAARRQEAAYEYLLTWQLRNRVGRALGWPEADRPPTIDETKLLEQLVLPKQDATPEDARPVTLSLADRFDVVLDAGRRIASALSAPAILSQVREAALRLLRGEQCLLLEVNPDAETELRLFNGEPNVEFSETKARRAITARRSVAFSSDLSGDEDAGDETTLAEEKSTLCAPIFVRGRIWACIYVVHGSVEGLFGADEERVADFITTIAGGALENADGFTRLEQLNATLEQRVANRTEAAESRARELARSNQELERIAVELKQTEEERCIAMEEAEAANRAKSQFLAAMSHEIRTPMNGIIGFTELALTTMLSSQQKGYLNIVKHSADELLRLLNDILDFSKIEAGKLELEAIDFDLRETLGDAMQAFAVPASAKGLELMFRVDANVPSNVNGDPGRLRQILSNLIGNAIKFTERGEILVDVGFKGSDTELIHFAVHDTGIGIPPDKQQRIFESFSQADSSTTRRFGGTGLGLAISSQLVKIMQGEIWVESEMDQGSTFHFTARLEASPQHAAPPLGLLGECEEFTALVVDDNETSRMILSDLLEDQGISVQAVDGAQALCLTKEWDVAGVDLVLLDAGITTVNAIELAEELLSADLTTSQLITLLPSAQPDLSTQCQETGIQQCLIKPAKHSDLFEAARAALRQTKEGKQTNEEKEVVRVKESKEPKKLGNDQWSTPASRSLRVLLAEDGPINQQVVTGLLQLRGHHVEVVDTGLRAVEAHRDQAFDIILMDVEMPHMDGMEATAKIRLREQETGSHIPIVGLSAHAMAGFRDQCLEAGMDDFISKPVQPDELFNAVECIPQRLAESLPENLEASASCME